MGIGLLLGISDVLDGLREALVLEGLVGAEGSVHTGGSSLEHHISVVAVLGHLGTDSTELGSSGSSDRTNLVVGEVVECLVLGSSLGRELGATLLGLLADVGHLVVKAVHGLLEVLASLLGVLLDLGSVGSDVLVGLLDLGVGRRSESREGTLLVLHSKLQVVGSLALVLAHDLAGLVGTGNRGLVALVSELSMSGKLALNTTHVAIKRVLGSLGIDGHLGKELLLHRGTSGLIEGEIASHVSTDGGDISTTASGLLGDLFLNLVEVLEQTHAPVGGVGDNHASLLDIHRLNESGVTDVEPRPNELIGLLGDKDGFRLGIAVGSDVHHRAADSQGRKEDKGNTSTGILRLHILNSQPTPPNLRP